MREINAAKDTLTATGRSPWVLVVPRRRSSPGGLRVLTDHSVLSAEGRENGEDEEIEKKGYENIILTAVIDGLRVSAKHVARQGRA